MHMMALPASGMHPFPSLLAYYSSGVEIYVFGGIRIRIRESFSPKAIQNQGQRKNPSSLVCRSQFDDLFVREFQSMDFSLRVCHHSRPASSFSIDTWSYVILCLCDAYRNYSTLKESQFGFVASGVQARIVVVGSSLLRCNSRG